MAAFLRSPSRSPCSHAGMPQHSSPFAAAQVDAVAFCSTSTVSLADLRLVVLHVAGLEEHGLAAGLPSVMQALLGRPTTRRSSSRSRAGACRRWMPEHLLHEPSGAGLHPVHHVRQTEARPGPCRRRRSGSASSLSQQRSRFARGAAPPRSGARAWGSRAGTRARPAACTGTGPRRACTGSTRPMTARCPPPAGRARTSPSYLVVDQREEPSGNESQYLKHMRQPWQTSKARVISLFRGRLVPVLVLGGVVGQAVGRLIGRRVSRCARCARPRPKIATRSKCEKTVAAGHDGKRGHSRCMRLRPVQGPAR